MKYLLDKKTAHSDFLVEIIRRAAGVGKTSDAHRAYAVVVPDQPNGAGIDSRRCKSAPAGAVRSCTHGCKRVHGP